MPLRLDGSCCCGRVSFSVETHTPVPYQLCYCGVCRRTAGGAGAAINLAACARSLRRHGRTRVWHAALEDGPSPAERHSCEHCATALWLFDPRRPELLHPLASAIDTPLPAAPSRVHIMLRFKPAWVAAQVGPGDEAFDELPAQSIEEWHRARGLWVA